ncbi:hypothetical protein [Mesorhizobium sp. B2-8-5]|uniref:hypothetical protein n=1 Tax=Mesorhizobium sp. B2-8-5 TaxID=2589903 RepID=UPI001D02534E|nr:hypothetical protein [Mesorhizobium sp. B2-8-5]UCI24447.1 hypothetical protein FJ430_23020 [Mesorhizobium sp. B2-8-5]
MNRYTLDLFVSAVAFAVIAAATSADAKCLAPHGEFDLGQYSCLAAGSNDYLARCETDQNVFSWNKIADYCPGGAPRVPTAALGSSCRGDGQTFPVGGYACLVFAGQAHLARCDVVLNSPSWTKMQESCSAMPSPRAAVVPPRSPWLKKALDLPRGLLNRF